MAHPICLLSGARATEEHLLAGLAELQRESRQQPELLRLPIRILVPSASLRLHLSERIVARLGCMAGVVIQTLQGLAISIVQSAGETPHRANALVELLGRRAALRETPLRQALEGFQDGLQGIAGVIRDLFDAGFETHSGEALLELIDDVPLSPRSLRRARSILKVAMDVERELTRRGRGGRAALYLQAAEALTGELDPLPTRVLFVHGFADVTGRAGDLLQRLARRENTRILIDHPRDPGNADEPERGIEFTRRLLQPLEGILGQAERMESTPAPAALSAFSAPGQQAEVRELARRIRILLDQGTCPERIGIVAREPKSYASALRRQLKLLAIPFSAPGIKAPMDAAARRILALTQLFGEGLRCPVDRWFDALGRGARAFQVAFNVKDQDPSEQPSASQMLLGLCVTGARRLEDVLRIQSADFLDAKGALALPACTGIQAASDQNRAGARFRTTTKSLEGAHLAAAMQSAKLLATHFEQRPETAPAAEHLAHFEALRLLLGWRADDAAEQRIAPALTSLAQGLGDESLSHAEFAGLLVAKLPQSALPPLGQRPEGAGVQVLDVMEARARTFEQLFLIGLNRDVFPRSLGVDPIFPDEIRSKIESILPDIPIRSRARLEDRYLFAQLLSSSEHVTLSWLRSGEDGKPRMLSPLVERLFDAASLAALERAPMRFPASPSLDFLRAPRDAHEQVILAALHGSKSDFEAHLVLALQELGQPRAKQLANLRARVLAAFEGAGDRGLSMAPWLGFLGTQAELGVRPDPRLEAPFVTRIEGIARCPWQTVLTRFLRLEPRPDPLGELPGISPMALGNIVHAVLCRIDQRVLGSSKVSLAEALAREPKPVDWPRQEEFERILLEEAHREAKLSHEPVAGFVRVLAECTRPYLKAAEELMLLERKQNPKGAFGVLGAEVEGRARATLPNGELQELVFKADRVERHAERIVLSDYKTGAFKTLNKLKQDGLPQATQLQPMAYILGALEEVQEARGRYLYLGARVERKEVIEVALDQDCSEQVEDFKSALGCVVEGWLAGVFFPRLMRPDKDEQNPDCEYCEVKEACLQGDSGAREAISSWSEPLHAHPAARPASELWQLRARQRQKQKASKGGED